MASTSSSTCTERELEEQLVKYGTKLLNPPASSDDLLTLVEKVEQLLTMVDQAPPVSLLDALLPSRKALVDTELLRHPDKDVQISILYCIHEIARITAPDAPYGDDLMKEIFELTIAAFGRLSELSTHCYTRAAAILDTVVRYRTCLVMLDLELDELVVDMFYHFLETIRSDHPQLISLAMETVMTSILEEIEEISLGLLSPLLQSVKKENEAASPLSWKLGKQVITNCAAKLKPSLMEAVSMGIALDDFADIVASICQNKYGNLERDQVDRTRQHAVKDSSIKLSSKKKSKEKRTSESTATSSNPTNHIYRGIPHKRGRPKKITKTMNEAAGRSLASLSEKHFLNAQVKEGAPPPIDVSKQCALDERLVGRRIKVWWPLDQTFYKGVVGSFDSTKKRHRVLYDDGEQEKLNLKKEHWELIED